MADELKAAVAKRIEELGIAPTPAAISAGLERNFINDILLGRKRNVRGDNFVKLARALQMAPAELLEATTLHSFKGGVVTPVKEEIRVTLSPGKSDPSPIAQARVQGAAQAGTFHRVDELEEDRDEWVNVPRDDEFPFARQLVFDIRGDSMNKLEPVPLPDGSRVVTVAFEDLDNRVPLQDGMVVIVEQTLADGQVREWSCKQIEIHGEQVEFHPRSTNPRHKPIVIEPDLEADDGRTVRVLAIVRGVTSAIPLAWKPPR